MINKKLQQESLKETLRKFPRQWNKKTKAEIDEKTWKK